VFGRLRIAGLFWSCLEGRPCTVVSTRASPEALREVYRNLVAGVPLFPLAALGAQCSQGLSALVEGRPVPAPSPREVQCGCGVSLGLSDHQIARVLSVDEGTVKKYL
jgi:DNA-binding NarL/FixJ family response regulator